MAHLEKSGFFGGFGSVVVATSLQACITIFRHLHIGELPIARGRIKLVTSCKIRIRDVSKRRHWVIRNPHSTASSISLSDSSALYQAE